MSLFEKHTGNLLTTWSPTEREYSSWTFYKHTYQGSTLYFEPYSDTLTEDELEKALEYLKEIKKEIENGTN